MERSQPRDAAPTQPALKGLSPVRCFWCERVHPGEHPLSVCRPCLARLETMGSLGMRGSYPLSDAGIDEALLRRSPGNYALGYLEDDAFRVFYVGRSDTDVRQRLHEWVGMPSRYAAFASPAKASWEIHSRGPFFAHRPGFGPVQSGESSYTRFAYSYADSAEEACAKEWRNFDAFGGAGLDNETEPT